MTPRSRSYPSKSFMGHRWTGEQFLPVERSRQSAVAILSRPRLLQGREALLESNSLMFLISSLISHLRGQPLDLVALVAELLALASKLPCLVLKLAGLSLVHRGLLL